MSKKTLVLLEKVSFPEFHDDIEVVAKIDTGARTGALHCVFVRVTEQNGQEIIEYQPFNTDHPKIKTKDFYDKVVISSNGSKEKRYFINTKVLLRGEEYPITLSLADRSNLKFEVLIGVKFLKDKFIVDVAESNV